MPINRGSIPLKGQRESVLVQLRQLKSRGGRNRAGLYLAEGVDFCWRALNYGAKFDSFICTPEFLHRPEAETLIATLPSTCPIYTAPQGLMAKCLEAKPTPPCLAMIYSRLIPWEDQLKATRGDSPLFIGVEDGENADNLGMMLRSAEACGVNGVLLDDRTVDPLCRRSVRASRGAVFSLNMSICDDLSTAIDMSKADDLQVIATSAKAEHRYDEVDFCRPTLLLVGNEHRGLSAETRDRADHFISIPMMGKLSSLNIAVAASLLLFEAQRQRGWSQRG